VYSAYSVVQLSAFNFQLSAFSFLLSTPTLNSFLNSTTVILLGHGTELNPGSALPILQHARALGARGLFADVRAAFWKQPPRIQEVLGEVKSDRVFIVPMFISEGYFSDEVIPRELGFEAGQDLCRKRTMGHQTWHYTRVVGTHPSMTHVLLSRAQAVTGQYPFPRRPRPQETTLFIAGHGTGRNENSRQSVERQAKLIAETGSYAAVHAIFMEEQPLIVDYTSLAKTKYAVVVPFFMSDGLHVIEDIPVLLGEPEKVVKSRLAAGQPTWRNPTEKRGVLTWYSSSVGSDPGLQEVILEHVRECAG
jgi:sirohydrochlorin cobaltochelatase